MATFYYPGWQLSVGGRLRPLRVENPYGLIDLALEEGGHDVELRFGSTPLRRWAGGVSLLALALLLVWSRKGKRSGRGEA